MSAIIVTRKPGRPASRVRIASEWDKDGMRGHVLLEVWPRLALLTPGTARRVGLALVRFAGHARPQKGGKRKTT